MFTRHTAELPSATGGDVGSYHLKGECRACMICSTTGGVAVVIILMFRGDKVKVAELTSKGTCLVPYCIMDL